MAADNTIEARLAQLVAIATAGVVASNLKNLADLGDVDNALSPQDRDILRWDSSASLWKAEALDDIVATSLRTGTGAGDTLLLQGYDVDGLDYTTFLTITANNVPAMVLSGDVTGTTQTAADNSTKLATTAYADAAAAGGGATRELDNLTTVAMNTSILSDTDVTDDLGGVGTRWRDLYASTVRTGSTDTNTVLFQARDVDGAAWTTFATLTAGNAPSFLLASDTTGVTQAPADNSTKLATTAYADAAGAGGGATTALSNLAAVAINTSLISDTDVTDDLGTAAIRWNDIFAATLQTGDTAADTLLLRAYDVDGASYTTFATLTANNTPTMALSGDVTGVTQSASDNSTKLATTAYADAAGAGGGATAALDNLAAVAINTALISDTDITDDLGTEAIRWKDIYAATAGTGQTATDTFILRGYDTDAPGYVDILTITANPTVTADLNAITTIGGNAIIDSTVTTLASLVSIGTINTGTWEGTTIAVDQGGTGQTSYTDGQLLIGNTTGNTLAKAALTAGTGVSVANGSGTITLSSNDGAIDHDSLLNFVAGEHFLQSAIVETGAVATGTWESTDVAVLHGGTGRSLATAYAVVCGGITDTGAHQSVAGLGSSGQVLTSNGAGALPTFQAVAGTGDVVGPASSTTNAIALFADTSGTLLKDYTSGAPTISDTGDLTMAGTITGVELITVDNLTIDGNTLSAGAGAININPFAGSAIVLDSTINVDAGVITGATSITSTAFVGALTGNADTVTTNANLTGEVTSTGNAAVVDPTAISGQGTETPVATDMLLFWDATDSALKKADASNFLSGSGDVTGDTASIDKELVRFNGTGGKTIESPNTDLATTTATLSDNADLTLYDAVNDGNPVFAIGSSAAERFTITPTYTGTAQTLALVLFNTTTALAPADSGKYLFNVDSLPIVTFDDNGIDLSSGKGYSINTAEVLNDTTLGAGVVNSSLTSLGTVTSGTWQGTTVAVDQGGTGDTTYTNGQLLIGNTTGNTLAKTTLTEGNGITVTNGTGTITVAADVASTGTPASNYLAHFTDANTVTGTNALLWDDTDLFIRNTGVGANPSIRIGNDSIDELHIETVYHGAATTLSTVNLVARSSSAAADAGQYKFDVDGMVRFTINDGGVDLDQAGDAYEIGGTSVLNATTLGAAVVNSSLTGLGTITSGSWQSVTDDIGVAYGGTGRSTSTTAYGVICAGTTAAGVLQTVGSLGSSGQVLTSGGAGVLPSWTTPAGSGTVTSSGTPLNNEIAVFATATDINSDSTFTWDSAASVFTAMGTTIDAGGVDVATGDTYAINSVDVLTATVLGSSVVTSSLTTVGTLAAGNATAIVDAASLTAAGKVELATAAEIDTGTDTTRAMGVDEFQASNRNIRYINIRLVEAATDVATGTSIGGDFEVPFAGEIVLAGTSGLVAFNDTAGVEAAQTMDIDINKGGISIFTTIITIDTGEKTSRTAATAPVLKTDGTEDVVAGDILTIDVDRIHATTAAKGLTVRIPVRIT